MTLGSHRSPVDSTRAQIPSGARPNRVSITTADGPPYRLSGLSFPTQFDLGACVELPYCTPWFDVPPAAPFGQTPQLGVLHPSLMRRARAAWNAVESSRKSPKKR